MRARSRWLVAYVLSAVMALGGCSGGSAEAPEFVGDFHSEKLSLKLARRGDGFFGTVSLGGKKFPLQATEQDGELAGSFESEGRAFDFVAGFDGGRLSFETEGTKYVLDRKVVRNPLADAGPKNPLADAGAANPLADGPGSSTATSAESPGGTAAPVTTAPVTTADGSSDEATTGERVDDETAARIRREQEEAARSTEAAPSLGATFKHPIGFFFRHPDDWTVQEQQAGFLALTPPDVHMLNGQPAEAFAVLGETAEGISKPDDPQVVQYLQQLVGSGFPFLRREGGVETRTYPTHSGVVLSWAGKSPTGLDAKARMWVTIMNGYAIGVLAITPKERFERRARVIEDIFKTFGFTKPKTDPRLYGSWRYTNVYSSGTFSMVSEEYLTLNADGSCLWSNQSMAGMEHHDSGGNLTGSSSVDSGNDGAQRGTWAAADKKIIMRWAGSSEEWNYIISGNSMLWKSDGSKKLWERTR